MKDTLRELILLILYGVMVHFALSLAAAQQYEQPGSGRID